VGIPTLSDFTKQAMSEAAVHPDHLAVSLLLDPGNDSRRKYCFWVWRSGPAGGVIVRSALDPLGVLRLPVVRVRFGYWPVNERSRSHPNILARPTALILEACSQRQPHDWDLLLSWIVAVRCGYLGPITLESATPHPGLEILQKARAAHRSFVRSAGRALRALRHGLPLEEDGQPGTLAVCMMCDMLSPP
jgi:hypothetical protein